MRHPTKDVDICDFCKKRVATIGAHGIRNDEVYTEDFCPDCYAKRNNISEAQLNRLKQDASELEEFADQAPQQKAKRQAPQKVKKRDVPAPVRPNEKQPSHRDTHVAPPSVAAPTAWTPRLPGA